MADTVTATSSLYIGFKNSLAKITYIKLSNPKNNLSEDEVMTAAEALIDSGSDSILIDSTTDGETFSEVETAYTESKKVIKLCDI